MRFQLNANAESIREQLKTAKGATLDDVLNWNATTWAHLISIASGLNPFSSPSMDIIPEVYKAFLPRLEFKPLPEDRKTAYLALKRALLHVNKAIVETTRSTYDQLLSGSIPNILEMIQSQFPGGLDEFLNQLEKELMDYEKRKLYLKAGYSMMTEEQAWLSRHHTLAVAIVAYIAAQPKRCLTNDEFISLAHDVGILQNGQITFTPFKSDDNASAVAQSESKDELINKVLQEAEASAAKSKQKLLDSLKTKKKK